MIMKYAVLVHGQSDKSQQNRWYAENRLTCSDYIFFAVIVNNLNQELNYNFTRK